MGQSRYESSSVILTIQHWSRIIYCIDIAISREAASAEEKDEDGELKKEQELIKRPVTEEDINFVLNTMYKEGQDDKPSIQQTFFGCCSAATKVPMNHDFNSQKSGTGKNYLIELVISLFPRKYVQQHAHVSDKAFFHGRGQLVLLDEETGLTVPVQPMIDALEEEISDAEIVIELEMEKDPKNEKRDQKLIKEKRKLINEKNKEIKNLRERAHKLIDFQNIIEVLLDTPEEGFFAAMMPVLSGDNKGDQRYTFTDKNHGNKSETSSNIIRNRPSIFTAHVADDTSGKRFAEKNRRFIAITPNAKKEKINNAMRLMVKKGSLTREEYDQEVVSKADKEKVKEIIARIFAKLKDHSKHFENGEYGARIFFGAALAEPILADEDEDVWRMTVLKRIEDYLAVNTKIKMDARPRLVHIATRRFYPITLFRDLAEILELMEKGGANIRSYLAKIYNEAILPAYADTKDKGLPSNDLGEKETHYGLKTEEIGQGCMIS